MKFLNLRYAFLLLLPLFVSSFYAKAQLKGVDNLTYFDDRGIHFGFYLGLNTMDYRLRNYKNVFDNPVFIDNDPLKANAALKYEGQTSFAAEIYQIMPGFTVGGVINLRLDRDFDFRFTPGMSLGNRHFNYIGVTPLATNGQNQDTYLSTASAYVDFPVGIRYKGFRHRNLRPYIYSGAAYRLDLENKRVSESVIHLRKTGAYAELGFGLDSYLEYFRFTAEFRFSYGLDNLIRHDVDPVNTPYFGYIFKEVNSNIFSLIMYFE